MASEEDRAPPSIGGSQASTPAGAVFLSYASQDAEAASAGQVQSAHALLKAAHLNGRHLSTSVGPLATTRLC
jgi:hypothetical protein